MKRLHKSAVKKCEEWTKQQNKYKKIFSIIVKEMTKRVRKWLSLKAKIAQENAKKQKSIQFTFERLDKRGSKTK